MLGSLIGSPNEWSVRLGLYVIRVRESNDCPSRHRRSEPGLVRHTLVLWETAKFCRPIVDPDGLLVSNQSVGLDQESPKTKAAKQHENRRHPDPDSFLPDWRMAPFRRSGPTSQLLEKNEQQPKKNGN